MLQEGLALLINQNTIECKPLVMPECSPYTAWSRLTGQRRDAVEFIKTTPGARLSRALVNLAHGLVIHLVAAVEDIALHPECASQIFRGLRLACPCHSNVTKWFVGDMD